jgi:hypothetical protein
MPSRASIRLGLPVLTALLASTGCSEPSTAPDKSATASTPTLASRTTQHFVDRGPFEASFVSNCTGDLITLSGTLSTELTLVSEPGSEQDLTLTLVLHGTATGEPSGAHYVLNSVEHHMFETPSLEAPHGVFLDKGVGVLVASGPGTDEHFSFQYTQVFTPPDGELNVVVDHFESVCRS